MFVYKDATMHNATRTSQAALSALAGLQVTMLAALMTKTPPHPPLNVAPFAMGPFLACSVSVALAAIVLAAANSRTGALVAAVAAVLALISYGPQKWFDPAIMEIWPAVLLGQIAAAAVLWRAYRALQPDRE
jgi:hypothetical membrane protein